MDPVKALKRVVIFSAAVLLASGVTTAGASTTFTGHISASVIGALNVTEVLAMNFGNFAITCTGNRCDTASSITLSDQGTRTATSAGAGTIALLNGGGVGAGQETGGQQPGFYSINAGGEGTGTQNIYVSFSDINGNIIDINHPANHVALSGPVPNAFTVDTFTFESDTGTTGYVQQNPATLDIYGYYVPLVNGTVTIRVGATLHTAAVTTPPPGQYTGTFNVITSF